LRRLKTVVGNRGRNLPAAQKRNKQTRALENCNSSRHFMVTRHS
jgi:hypothetical protein